MIIFLSACSCRALRIRPTGPRASVSLALMRMRSDKPNPTNKPKNKTKPHKQTEKPQITTTPQTETTQTHKNCPMRGSNPRPKAHKTFALTPELMGLARIRTGSHSIAAGAPERPIHKRHAKQPAVTDAVILVPQFFSGVFIW